MNQQVARFTFKKGRGFSFLELVVVVCLIAILFAYSVVDYQKRVNQSEREVLHHQAQAFKRSIDNIRAISSLQQSSRVDLGTGIYVYLFESGWPYGASLGDEDIQYDLSAENCRSLWQYLFTSPHVKNDKSDTKHKYYFETDLVKNHICRYKQIEKQENPYFFDYDVETGVVEVFFE